MGLIPTHIYYPNNLRILRWRRIVLFVILVELFLQMVNTVGKHLFDFREKLVLNPVEIKTLQLNHAVAVAPGKFLNPMAHSLLAVLNFIM